VLPLLRLAQLWLAMLIGRMARLAAAQYSSKPPSSKPSKSNPSLDSILTLIQDKLNEQDEIRYTMTSRNTVSGERSRTTTLWKHQMLPLTHTLARSRLKLACS
jgi:hypothetical protein